MPQAILKRLNDPNVIVLDDEEELAHLTTLRIVYGRSKQADILASLSTPVETFILDLLARISHRPLELEHVRESFEHFEALWMLREEAFARRGEEIVGDAGYGRRGKRRMHHAGH